MDSEGAFVHLDPLTGESEVINPDTGIGGRLHGGLALDQINNEYFLIGFDKDPNALHQEKLFTIDTITGQVKSNYLLKDKIGHIQYDSQLEKLVGLNESAFLHFDPKTGESEVINPDTGIGGKQSGGIALDQINNEYFLVGYDNDPNALHQEKLFTIDTITGQVKSNYLLDEDIGSIQYDYGEKAPVPEPSTLLLFGVGILGLLYFFRRKLFQNPAQLAL